MQERRRAILAIVAVLVAVAAFDRPIVAVSVATPNASPSPMAQAAVNLGILGTVVLRWTARRLTPGG